MLWEDQDVWLNIWRAFLSELNERQQIKWSECFMDGSFNPAKKGPMRRQNQEGEGHKGPGRPRQKPERLICDKGYDSDPLREQLKKRGIELIAPHRNNRRKAATQDGRALRRYSRRWKIERSIAWFGNYRRVIVRWDRKIEIYRAFVHIACALITCNKL